MQIRSFVLDLARYTAEHAPDEVEEYCNPSTTHWLPFLASRHLASDRFCFDNEEKFRYYGRANFVEVYNEVMSMRRVGRRKLFLHGTSGSGKSHILAALACLLTRKGKPVVYLADCVSLVQSPMRGILASLTIAFANHEDLLEQIKMINSQKSLEEFCDAVARRNQIYWIVDQANALDTMPIGSDRVDEVTKAEVRKLLDKITCLHFKIASSSGNYTHAITDQDRSTSERRLNMYGGLSEVIDPRRRLQPLLISMSRSRCVTGGWALGGRGF